MEEEENTAVSQLQAAESLSKVERILGSCEHLPATPQVFVRLWSIIDRPDTTVDELTEVVESDPSLAASLLRIVNSVSFGLNRHISSVREGIVYLGFSQLKSLSIAIVVKTGLLLQRPQMKTMDRNLLWRHCLSAGIAARFLAREANIHQGTAFVAGLLHDMGWMLMDLAVPAELEPIFADAARKNMSTEALEFQRFGFTHADVGAWLMERWGLPSILCDGVRYHHWPGKSPRHQDLAAVVHIADVLATQAMPYLTELPMPEDAPDSVWRIAKVSPTVRLAALHYVSSEMTRMSTLLRLDD